MYKKVGQWRTVSNKLASSVCQLQVAKSSVVPLRPTRWWWWWWCQLESTLALTYKEEKLTAKYRSVCSSDIVFLLYHNGFVGLLFRCNIEQSKSFSILFEQPVSFACHCHCIFLPVAVSLTVSCLSLSHCIFCMSLSHTVSVACRCLCVSFARHCHTEALM